MSLPSLNTHHLRVLIWSLVVAGALVVPGNALPELGRWEWLDKPLHALLFAIHYALLARFLSVSMKRSRSRVVAAVVSGVYGLLLEAGQIWVPGRAWEWGDLAADLAGIALAALLVALLRARLRGTF